MKCIVCREYSAFIFKIIESKKYWKCENCLAKFLDKKYFLTTKEEKNHYLLHQNIVKDKKYRNFLSRLTIPLKQKLSISNKGLDFGCGHGPALADIFIKEGFEIKLYDPFFFPNKNILKQKFDFITCSETVEHFHNPYEEFNLINRLLNSRGWLGVMTCFSTNDNLFEKWHYRRDPTHVVFYNEETFKVIAKARNWNYEIIKKDIVLFYKN